jgi:hypothetical protein
MFVRVATHPARGFVLIVGLLVLLLMTLLALVVMMRTSTELMMAASEQYRRRASQAASAAIEDSIAQIGAVPPIRAASVMRGPSTLADGSFERFSSRTTYIGRDALVPGSSAGTFDALDYVIQGFGTSSRAAQDSQTQGLAVIVPTNGVSSFTRISGGLP